MPSFTSNYTTFCATCFLLHNPIRDEYIWHTSLQHAITRCAHTRPLSISLLCLSKFLSFFCQTPRVNTHRAPYYLGLADLSCLSISRGVERGLWYRLWKGVHWLYSCRQIALEIYLHAKSKYLGIEGRIRQNIWC